MEVLYKEHNQKLAAENRALQDEVRTLRNQLHEHSRRIPEYESSLGKSQRNCTELLAQLDQEREKSFSALALVSSREAQLARQEQLLESLQIELESVRQELVTTVQTLEEERSNAQQAQGRVDTVQNEVRILESRLQRSTDELSRAHNEIGDQKSIAAQLRLEVESLKRAKEESQRQVDSLHREMSDIKHSFELERRELKYGYETSLSRDRESQHEVVRQMKDTISTLQSSQRSSGLVQSAPVLGGGFPMPHSISITQPAAQVPQPVSVPLSKQSHRDDSKHSSCHSQRRYHHRSHRETTRRPSRSRSPDGDMYRSRSRSPHYSTHTHRASVPVREEAFDRVYDSSTIPQPTVQYTAAVPASSGTASSTGINEYRLGFLDALRTSGTSTAQPPAPAPALAPTPATATTFRAGDTAPDYTTEGHEYSRRHSYIDAPNIRRQRKGIGALPVDRSLDGDLIATCRRRHCLRRFNVNDNAASMCGYHPVRPHTSYDGDYYSCCGVLVKPGAPNVYCQFRPHLA